MSQYTFDTASLERKHTGKTHFALLNPSLICHTEDRIGCVKCPNFDGCRRSTLFDATYCDSPSASRQNSLIPASSSPLSQSSLASAVAKNGSGYGKVSSRESSKLLDRSQSKNSVAQAKEFVSSQEPQKAGPSRISLALVFKKLAMNGPFRR